MKPDQRRNMTELKEDALCVITDRPGLRCGGIGDQLFKHVKQLNGSAPFARVAGKVMKRLEADGLARYDPKANGGFGGWFPVSKQP